MTADARFAPAAAPGGARRWQTIGVMGPVEAKRFGELLERRRAELFESGDVSLESTARDGGEGKVDEDAAPLSEMNQVIASTRNRERAERLEAIAEALERLQEDPESFGLCEVCDEPIPPKRLELMPWVTMCIRCQERLEADAPRGRRHITDYK